jgi:hypothetical protein
MVVAQFCPLREDRGEPRLQKIKDFWWSSWGY